jgi:two-component system response regulator GlrR
MTRHFEAVATVPVAERFSVRGGRIEAVGDAGRLLVGVERQRIGRARQCAMVLDDPTVSALHAEVQATPMGTRLLDLGSRNGTFLGDTRIVEAYLTGPCDFRCGQRALRFVPEASQDIVIEDKQRFGSLVGTTPEMLSLFATLERFASSGLSIVINGETGTGKERVARAIHDASPRKQKPFLAINCAAMPDALLEDELFGHARGAFTGADRERSGLFVEADGGTLLFDEVAEMSVAMQAKLLRVLENGEVRAIGTERTRKVDVRTLFATHADLGEAVNKRRFREDLYFRIAQVTVEIPPLRRRLEDMQLLLEDILEELGRLDTTIDDESMGILTARSWPGNVRELRSFVRVALVGSPAGTLSLAETFRAIPAIHKVALETMNYDEAKKEFKRRYYMGLYAACRGNVSQMAKRAGKHRMTVREVLRDLRLDVGSEQGPKDAGTERDRVGNGPVSPWRKMR